jgi:hypothetical protein
LWKGFVETENPFLFAALKRARMGCRKLENEYWDKSEAQELYLT